MVVEINSSNIDIITGSLLDKGTVIMSINKNPFAKYLVYIYNDEVVGCLYYSDIYDRIEINQLSVFDAYKRQGIATKLINELLKNKKNITLEVKCDNIPAIKLYKKCGFKEVAKREGYYNGTDGILMSLEMK